MPLMVTEIQRGPSALLSYSLICECSNEREAGESVIDNLVAVTTKIKRNENNDLVNYMAFMKLNTEENVKIMLRASCDNPSFNKKWICRKQWSEWQELGVYTCDADNNDEDDITISDEEFNMYNLRINISVRKIEKPELSIKMYLDTEFIDFSLSAANGSVAVHKVVIASHSEVFKAMLKGEWKETIEGRIEVKGTTRECLEHLKDYMYLDVLPEEGLRPLLLLGSQYMIGNLKTRCISKLVDTLTPENLFELQDFACSYNIPELAFEILHSTPSEIIDKAYKSKKAKESPIPPESADTSTDTIS